MVEINMRNLAKKVLDDLNISIQEKGIYYGNDDVFFDIIDDFITDNLKDNENFTDAEYQRLLNELDPFITQEILIRTKGVLEHLDKEERDVLKNEIQDYDTYIEEDMQEV
jgi:hypothetical protein